MHTRLAGWVVLAMTMAADAFLPRPLLLSRCSRTLCRTGSGRKVQCSIVRTEATRAAVGATKSSMAIDIEDIRGKRLYVKFAAFGFFDRECQLELKENGDCQFSKGIVAKTGAWRVEEEEGKEYLQFSSPLTDLYSEIFFVPSGLLFWRVPLVNDEEGKLVLESGQIISERKQLFGLRQYFVDEGTFKARLLADDEEFPVPADIDLSDIEVPEGLRPRKKRKKDATEKLSLMEQVAPPPPLMPGEQNGE